MSMKNVLEELKNYLNNTPNQQVLKDWESTEKYDEVGIPVDDFLQKTTYYYKLQNGSINIECDNLYDNIQNPKFTSDFLFYNLFQSKFATV